MNVEQVGSTDSESFAAKKVPSITFHSLTQATLGVLHSDKDNFSAMRMDDYYESYRLLCGYLLYLDSQQLKADAADAKPQEQAGKQK